MKSDRLFTTDGQKVTFRLLPLPLWKSLAAIFLLLSVPVAILVRQAVGAFGATAAIAENEIRQQVEKVAGQLVFEAKNSVQVKELFRDYFLATREYLKTLAYFAELRGDFGVVIPPTLDYGLFLAQKATEKRLQHLEAGMRRLLPGLQLVKWGLDMMPRPDSDQLTPRWAYQKLAESVVRSVNPGGKERGMSAEYLEYLPMLNRYFTGAHGLGNFIKFPGDLLECGNPAGDKLMMYWESERTHGLSLRRRSAGGFLGVVDGSGMEKFFGMQLVLKRKNEELNRSGVSSGWIVEAEPEKKRLPGVLLRFNAEDWVEWLLAQPDGIYERFGVIISVRRNSDGLVILNAADTASIILQFERRVFLLGLLIVFLTVMPLWLVFSRRSNGGMAVSIRFQIAGLFLFSMLLPVAVIFQLGSELLLDRQKSFEVDAYKEIERVKKDLDENSGYAFRQLEKISEKMGQQLMQLNFDAKGRFAEPANAAEVLQHFDDKIRALHVYLFNSYADLVFSSSSGEENRSEGVGLVPLVQSLAKLKLRSSGKLRTREGAFDVSLMDLVVEATGGSNLNEISAILNNRENRAFETAFSGRRSIFYVGQFSTAKLPGETFSLVMLIRDTHFERLYMRLMIEKLCARPVYRNRIQLYFGENDASGSGYFYDAPLADPWFPYTFNGTDSLRLGRLSEPTRFTGNTVKDKVTLETGQRHCLFYSFRPAGLLKHSAVALFNYEEITRELRRLQQFIFVSLLVSLLVVLILARIMARSLIEPVVLLRQGVERVESGNFQTDVVLPGQDEIVELAQAFNKMNRGLDERERMTRYLSRSAVDAVVRGEDRVMGGQRVPATILFSDIRNFTTISESNSAENVVGLLNDYFAAMNQVVEKYGGDIDKFIGDAIMAQFIPSEERSATAVALDAVKCALEMMAALAEFNRQREQAGLFPIKIGVGINSGEVIAGNIGSPGRMDRTVIGDAVNLASRLEGMSKQGKHTCIIISGSTLRLVRDQVEVERLAETMVKGKAAAVEMFEVIRLTGYN